MIGLGVSEGAGVEFPTFPLSSLKHSHGTAVPACDNNTPIFIAHNILSSDAHDIYTESVAVVASCVTEFYFKLKKSEPLIFC